MVADPSVLRSLLEHMPESVAVYRLDATVVYVNPATEQLFGMPLATMVGRSLWSLFPDAVGNPFHDAFERVAAGGADEVFDHYYPPFDRWMANRIARVGEHIHVVARDVTEDVRRRRRLEALASISEVLTADELELGTATQAVAEILASVLAADCSLAMLTADRAWLELAASATSDPGAAEATQALARMPADRGHPGQALRTRAPVLAQAAELEAEAARVTDPIVRAVVERYQPGSVLVAPLLVGDEALGVLIAARRRGQRALTTDDRTLVTDIAASVGLFLAHARRRAEATSLRHRLAAVTDSNPSLVAFVDRELRYQYVNASYERWFHRGRDQFLGQRLDETLGPVAFAVIAPDVRRVLAGTPVHLRTLVPYPSGARHVDAHYVPITNAAGEVEGFAAVVLDVSAESQLAEAERRRHDEERRATRRLESLLAVTSKLAAAARPEDIARALVDEGVTALEAAMAGMWLLSADGQALELSRERGFRPEHAAAFARVELDSAFPLADCLRLAQPIWVESRADYAARYPQQEPVHRPDAAPPLAFGILPLTIEGRVVGCVNFTFHDERRLTADERTYLEVLVSHGAEALRRAHLYAELRDVSETREAMIQASPAAIILLDDAGGVHAWNPAAERIYGWPAAAVLGQPLPSIDPSQRDGFRDLLARIIGGEVIEREELRRRRADGEWFDAELYAAPVRFSDGRTRCLSIVVDVTERKRVERGRLLVGAATAIFNRSLDWEATLAEVVRLPVPDFADWCCVDLLGDDGSLQRVAVSQDGPPDAPMPRRLEHASERGGASLAIATGTAQLLRDLDDGARQWSARAPADLAAPRALQARSSLSVPVVIGDRVLGALSFASMRRNFDDLDVALATELGVRTAAAIDNARLYRAARSARDDAEAASRAKDQFLAMLGHELRNPLAPMTTALHLMRLRAPELVARERAVIERQVAHLSRLVDDLLDVSRITRGKVELRRERTTLAAVVTTAIEITSPLLEQRRHRLTVEVPPELAVHGDPTRLSQIVANLLTNAAKYTDAGGEIDVRALRRGGEVVLLVRDNGSGLTAEMLPRIFEIFVQAPQPSARTDGGLGLGLTIVRSLVELHGGTVVARSDGPGHGTELEVSLPAAPELAVELAPAVAAPARSSSTLRVLVVDDNEDAAIMLGHALDAEGHDIRTAFDGPSALLIAGHFRPDVAVLDIGLPVMDGYELAERLRATPALAGVRLIALTGYGQASDRARSRDAGFEAHLAKPVSVEALVRLVEKPS